MKRVGFGALLLLTSMPALAETPDSGDTAWILTSTALVLFMTIPGLALFYGGLVRNKNVLSVLMQCFALTCLMSLLWFAVGYSLAFTGDGAFIGGFDRVLLAGLTQESLRDSIPESAFALFQMTFAIITPALIVGGFAERMRFSAMLIFSSLWLLLVYVPVCHWVWGGGWLSQLGDRGVMDFAGGVVVHITAGVAAIVAALTLGARRGFPQQPMPPHNMPLTITGAGMLWVGWFGFNGGSALTAGGDAAMAMLVTHLSAAAGAFTWLVAEWVRFDKPSALGAVTGMVAGLGTITPASGYVGPAGALVIGILAGLICFMATNYVKRSLKIDDSLDVFPVHGVGGILGTLLTGIFASNALGLFSGQEAIAIGDQLGVQAIGVVATIGYTAIVSWGLLKLTNGLVGNRVADEEEVEGLDLVLHNERAYDV
ncbi:MAG: ammonium transporter [Pseudomonadales bacterium]|nr:ammonium transporter [Pseudomonadales bacterium]MCP5183809.1 ammonium transporter [Pseudomonadales bacterium]